MVDKFPKFIPHQKYVINQLNINNENINAVLDFINRNYVDEYKLFKDYLKRKVNFPGSVSLVLTDDTKIIGFIYCSPLTLNNNECGYVDLLTVHKSYRNQNLATLLVAAFPNFANFKHYIHKKDKCPLHFPYFY